MQLNRFFEDATLSKAFLNALEQRLREGEEFVVGWFGRGQASRQRRRFWPREPLALAPSG